MPRELFCRLNDKRLMFPAIAIAALSFCFASRASGQTYPQTTWTIHIGGTASAPTAKSRKPTYKYTWDPPTGGCPYANKTINPDGQPTLNVCEIDKVNWVAENSNGSKMSSSEMVVYLQEPILLNENDSPTHGFHASNGNSTGGPIAPHALLGSQHKYYVIALDESVGQTYYDDPKIIIGTGHIEDLFREIRNLSEAIRAFLPEDSAAEKLLHDVDVDVTKVEQSLKLK